MAGQVYVTVLVALTRYFMVKSEEEQPIHTYASFERCACIGTKRQCQDVRVSGAVCAVWKRWRVSTTTAPQCERCRNSHKPIASPYTLYNIVCISNRKRYEAFVRCSLCSLRFNKPNWHSSPTEQWIVRNVATVVLCALFISSNDDQKISYVSLARHWEKAQHTTHHIYTKKKFFP